MNRRDHLRSRKIYIKLTYAQCLALPQFFPSYHETGKQMYCSGDNSIVLIYGCGTSDILEFM
jgi:hypothetical protein